MVKKTFIHKILIFVLVIKIWNLAIDETYTNVQMFNKYFLLDDYID